MELRREERKNAEQGDETLSMLGFIFVVCLMAINAPFALGGAVANTMTATNGANTEK